MENADLMSEGLTLLVLGMGTVYVFLALLVLVTTIMSSMVQKYLPAPVEIPAKRNRQQSSSAPVTDHKLLAIISAAIHQHRTKK